jgi:hypothetical protein
MSTQWTDELKQEVIDAYTAAEPTAETSTEIIEELAEKHEKTVNGIRMILIKAEVYVKKTAKTSSSSSSSGEKTTRKTKQESLDELSALLSGHGVEVDTTIIDKLTGKAAEFFITSIKTIIEN